MARWPGKIPAGRVSDEIVHAVDLFPTLASLAGAEVPKDRPVDGVDQSGFFQGTASKSAREGILVWCADRLQAVKWRNYKVHFYRQETMVSPAVKLPVPLLLNLYTNPREEEDKPTVDSWVVGPVLKMVAAFEESVKRHPLHPHGDSGSLFGAEVRSPVRSRPTARAVALRTRSGRLRQCQRDTSAWSSARTWEGLRLAT